MKAALLLALVGSSLPSVETPSPLESSAARPSVVRFVCADMEQTRFLDRAWSLPFIEGEVARGWQVERRESCEAAEAFLALVGSRGKIATCVLDHEGSTLGIYLGYGDARKLAAFLSACRMHWELEAAHPDPAQRRIDHWLERADARLELGAGTAAVAAWIATVERAIECGEHTLAAALSERIARVRALQGELGPAREWLERARAEGLDRAPLGVARGAVTEAIWLLKRRQSDQVPRVLEPRFAQLDTTPCEHESLLELAMLLHTSVRDDLALCVLAALEAGHPGQPMLDRIRGTRGHFDQPNGHEHGAQAPR